MKAQRGGTPRRDTVIVIEQRTTTPHPEHGTPIATWAELVTVAAEVTDMLPSRGEKIAEGISVARRPCRVRIGYRDDITSAMRIRLGTRTLRIITMPAEMGRLEGLEFMAEEATTQGQEP